MDQNDRRAIEGPLDKLSPVERQSPSRDADLQPRPLATPPRAAPFSFGV